MKVLLLQDTKNLGKKYDIVSVNDGFAQNNLFPKKIALPANSSEAINILKEKEKKFNQKTEQVDNFWILLRQIPEIIIEKPADKNGHFYSKISEKEILTSLEILNLKIPPKVKVLFKNSEVKEIGNFEVAIQDPVSKNEHTIRLITKNK